MHTHVLPGVDDGAPTMEYALQMLRNAVASDVTTLAVTPHYDATCEEMKRLEARFLQLKQAAEGIPVELVLGAEVPVNKYFPDLLREGKLPTINGSRYLLTEFASNTKETDFADTLQNIRDHGYVPLIAHPERYAAVWEDPGLVMQWLDMGCHLQLTGGSLLGEYGKNAQQAATFLVKNDLVACVASDAHGLHNRSNFLLDVFDHLSVRYSRQYAKCLMYETPMRICNNEVL